MSTFPKRTIHVDYHTAPFIGNIAQEFDAEAFAKTMKDAHVDSATVFATCHHGHAYWDTDRPERHPGLPPQLDLLGEQIQALHRHGIKAPVYFSVTLNEFCANTHPEWISMNPETGAPNRFGPNQDAMQPGWRILDMASPYQDYLFEQVQEVIEKYGPLDGVFMDICIEKESIGQFSLSEMKNRGLDPNAKKDRQKFIRDVTYAYMERFQKLIEPNIHPDCASGVWFNSRPKTNLSVEKKFLKHLEIEALSIGALGNWLYPYTARVVRPFDMPTLSHTGRFFADWGDHGGFAGKWTLMFDCCRILSQGMTNGIGDAMHPSGTLSPKVYQTIQEIYGHIKSCEPYLEGGQVMIDVAVITNPALGGDEEQLNQDLDIIKGWLSMLIQLKLQFDIIQSTDELDSYQLLICPEDLNMTPTLAKALEKHIEEGKQVIFSGPSCQLNGQPALPAMGLESAHTTNDDVAYLNGILHGEGEDFTQVVHGETLSLKVSTQGQSLLELGKPYFQRRFPEFCGHSYTPNGPEQYGSAIVLGRGVCTTAFRAFKNYGQHGHPNLRNTLASAIHATGYRAPFSCDGPTHLETSLVKTSNSQILHLLSFLPMQKTPKRAVVEDPFPIQNMNCQWHLPSKPKRVFLAPEHKELEFSYDVDNKILNFQVSFSKGHTMVITE